MALIRVPSTEVQDLHVNEPQKLYSCTRFDSIMTSRAAKTVDTSSQTSIKHPQAVIISAPILATSQITTAVAHPPETNVDAANASNATTEPLVLMPTPWAVCSSSTT